VIVFDLHCEQRHTFEAWFASSDAFEQQRVAQQLCCPYCPSRIIDKAIMAPRISPKGSGHHDMPTAETLLPKLAALQRNMLAGSTWVGDDFAGQARAMSDGETTPATIHGTATRADVKALNQEGVAVMPLLFPVVPPDKVN
jgi:hypothetical protein